MEDGTSYLAFSASGNQSGSTFGKAFPSEAHAQKLADVLNAHIAEVLKRVFKRIQENSLPQSV